MGLFDKMTYEEAFAVITSMDPSNGDLNKAEKTIGKMTTDDKRVDPAVALLNLHGKRSGTPDAAFDTICRSVAKFGFNDEIVRVMNTEVFFKKFYNAYMGGSLKGAYITALCFEKGWGTWRDHDKAVEVANLLRDRTDDEHARKVCAVVFGSKDTPVAPVSVTEESDMSAEECYQKAEALYDSGKAEESIPWYEKAADLGHVRSMNVMGFNYMHGDGVEVDIELAAKWLKKAVDNGYAKAKSNLGRLGLYFGYEMDPKDVFDLLKSSAMEGEGNAFAPLSDCYYQGFGCEENQKLATYWAIKAIQDDDTSAYALLGVFYNEGYYVPQVKSMAKYCFIKLKEEDGVDMFERLSDPIPDDLEPVEPVLPEFDDTAPDFFTEECPYSQYIRALHYLHGNDGEKAIPVDAAKGEELLIKAADQGLARALHSLGIKYIDPLGRGQVRYDEDGAVTGFVGDNERGLSLLRRAADLGDYEAIDCMIMLETEDIGISAEESRHYEEWQETLYQEGGTYSSEEETRDADTTEDCLEEVYEQEGDTADEFETMTDYYKACVDTESSLYADGYGNLARAVKTIAPFFQAVINNLEERDPGTAQEFLAEIVQVDVSALNEATNDDGIFSAETVELYDLCECALKCAYNACLAEPNELTETAMLHFAYYLYNEYSTLNDRSPSNFFQYYIDYYIQTYGIEQNVMWDIGALYFARMFVNDQQYSAIPEGEVYYEFEESYGEFLDGLFERDDMLILPNIRGCLYDADLGFIDAAEEEDETAEDSGIQTLTTFEGDVYCGYVNENGECHGWGKMDYANGDYYIGFWRNGLRNGFGIELWEEGVLRVGTFEQGTLNGVGFERHVGNLSGKYRLIETTYFKDGEAAENPAFTYDRYGREHSLGDYAETMRYFGQTDNMGFPDGWCCLWDPSEDPMYYEEGMYEEGLLEFGLRAWLHADDTISWAYGGYTYNSDESDYTFHADIYGYKGKISVDENAKPILKYYQTGQFAGDYLNGDGTQVYADGLTIRGEFKDGHLIKITRVIKPNGEIGLASEYEEYLSE